MSRQNQVDIPIRSHYRGSGFERAERAIATLDNRVLGLNSSMTRMAGALLAAASVERLSRAVGQTIEASSRLAKDADTVGLLTDEFQRLQFGFELAGVSADAFTTGMQRFGRGVGEAADGVGELGRILDANNISLRNADGTFKSQSRLLREYAELIRNAETEAQQLYLAQTAFGRGGADFQLALRNGAQGVRDLASEADRAGGVLDENLLRRAEEIDDRWARLARTFSVTVRGAILSVADALTEAEEGAGEMLRSSLAGFQSQAQGLERDLGFARLSGTDQEVAELESRLLQVQNRIRSIREYIGNEGFGGPTRRGGLSRQAPVVVPPANDNENDETNAVSRLSREADLRDDIIDLTALQRREQEGLNDTASFYAQTLTDGLLSVALHGEKAEDVIARLVTSLGEAALQAALLGEGPLADLFGSGNGGLLGSLLNGLRGNATPAIARQAGGLGPFLGGHFEGGGYTGSGARAGGLDGKGGFAAIVHPNEGIFDFEKGTGIVPKAQAGGGAVQVVVRVEKDGGLRAYVENTSGQVAAHVVQAASPSLVNQSVAATGGALSAGKMDGAMAGRYNLSRAARAR